MFGKFQAPSVEVPAVVASVANVAEVALAQSTATATETANAATTTTKTTKTTKTTNITNITKVPEAVASTEPTPQTTALSSLLPTNIASNLTDAASNSVQAPAAPTLTTALPTLPSSPADLAAGLKQASGIEQIELGAVTDAAGKLASEQMETITATAKSANEMLDSHVEGAVNFVASNAILRNIPCLGACLQHTKKIIAGVLSSLMLFSVYEFVPGLDGLFKPTCRPLAVRPQHAGLLDLALTTSASNFAAAKLVGSLKLDTALVGGNASLPYLDVALSSLEVLDATTLKPLPALAAAVAKPQKSAKMKATTTTTTTTTTTAAPPTEAPATEPPAAPAEAPATEAPATEAPASEAPASEAPATEAPASEAPASEASATEAPAAEAYESAATIKLTTKCGHILSLDYSPTELTASKLSVEFASLPDKTARSCSVELAAPISLKNGFECANKLKNLECKDDGGESLAKLTLDYLALEVNRNKATARTKFQHKLDKCA